jgi:hypothetical protein
MVETTGRWKLWTILAVAAVLAAGVAVWLLAPRDAGAAGGSDEGYVVAIAVMLYILLATRRDEMSPKARRALGVAVALAAVLGAAVYVLAR